MPNFVFSFNRLVRTDGLAHNHPTGDPSPSRDDIALTREVRSALKAVGVSLHDHIIIGRKGHVSLRSMNVIDGWK